MWRRILCGVDFSDTSRAAVELAARLGRSCGAAVSVVHVRERPAAADLLPDPSREEVERELDAVRAELDRWRVAAERQTERDVDAIVTTGAPAEEIVRLAGERPFDLVVTGTHRRTGLGRLVLGSVAARVVREAPCAVLVARASPASWGGLLCAVDFEEPSRVAVRDAAELARVLDAQLTLVHVFTPVAPAVYAPSLLTYPPRELEELVHAKLERQLVPWVADAEVRAHRPVAAVVVPGDPVTEILRVAAERGCAAVVVGTHGRTGVRRLVLGSIAERMVHEAGVPVLVSRERPPVVVRPAEHDQPDPPGRHDHELVRPFR